MTFSGCRCTRCASGYKGRVGIYEVLEMEKELAGESMPEPAPMISVAMRPNTT